MKTFYKSVGIVLNRIIEAEPKFEESANFLNIVQEANLRQVKNLKKQLIRYFERYMHKIYIDDVVFKESMQNVLMQEEVNITLKEFREKDYFSAFYLGYSKG
ncbi:hypothetical protein [Ammoniphilus sp. 3BR4]|uniref:hypothetical protein n=1 Tax=Ammoniphilus sp. 3BR4 TaxID=3158265 RepID=UPI0034654AC0